MCLVAVYLRQSDSSEPGEPIFSDVARVECEDGQVLLWDLFGQRQSVEANIRMVDLIDNRIVLESEAVPPGGA